jgi:hypothetical protein
MTATLAAFVKIAPIPLGCSSPPCDWCGRTSTWLAYDIGQLMGASCASHYRDLARSVAMSEGGCVRR